MTWVGFVIAVAAVAVLTALSATANRQLGAVARLPMQWSLDGQVIWSAPRQIAPSLTPAIAALLMFGTGSLLSFAEPDEMLAEVIALLVMSIAFIAAHLFHLRLLRKSLSR